MDLVITLSFNPTISEGGHTESILEPSAKRTASRLVIWIVLEKEVYLRVWGSGHHVQLQVVSHIGVGAIRAMRPGTDQRARLAAHVMFMVEIENKEPSSSQFPRTRMNFWVRRQHSNVPEIMGTFDTWPRRTAY